MELEFKNLSKKEYDVTLIAPISLKLKPGIFNTILGPTLSGKTTLLRLMAGLDKPTSGEIWHKNINVTNIPVQKRNVAMVYQQFINYPSMTVFENIASPLRVKRIPENEIKLRVQKVAELLKISPLLKRRPSELSGGQQQRTAIARALTKEAELVLLDEPLANLDYKLREELREELPRLFEETGATVVYTTTEPAEALLLGGYSATLHEGRITQFGPTQSVYKDPKSLIAAKTFSDPPLNTVKVEKKSEGIYLDGGVHWKTTKYLKVPNGDYILGFRAHHLKLSLTKADDLKLSGKVLVTELSGSESFVHLQSNENNWVVHAHGIYNFQQDEKIEMYLSLSNCYIFDAEGIRVYDE
ncbi:MAG: ABC transporter ATP-binding protein [SAR324 cluster bacterium]|jgi:glycerol transport system ATP-binding protein|nr:ABC transporter ATP-binding protein [SAR324 cluster bacterium]